ncbi:hypothetical protein Tco_1075949, partial [Tanacetum coccineum]
EFQQPEFEGYGPKTSKSVIKDISNKVRETPNAPLVKELVSNDNLEKKTVSPTVAKIKCVRSKQQEKPVRKPVKYAEMYRLIAITIKEKGWPKAVNTARPNSTVVNAVRENQVNAVKALGHPQKKDQGYVNSRCSRHMTGNMSYLSGFKEFDGGYVTFGGEAKGGKITGKGTLKTDATAKAKTVNGEVQIQALVDGKKVIVTETSMRRALQLKDVEGTECLPNATIFAELERMCAKTTAWNEFSSLWPLLSSVLPQTKNLTFPKPITDEATNEEHVLVHSNDPLLSVLDLENTKTSEDAMNTKLKEGVKKLERRNKSRTPGLKRLRKVGRSAQVVSSEDEEVTLVDEAQERNDDNLMFDTRVLDEQEVEVEKVVSTTKVTTAIATTTTVDELTLAQSLIEIKAAKPKAVTTAATTTTTTVTRPKARGVAKGKGKAKMIEPEKPLKKKDQILMDEEIAQRLQEELQAELVEEERLARQKEEEDNLISWDNTQAMIELMDKRKKHFAKLKAEEIRRKPPTKAQRNQMCTYLKNMANYKHSQLKNKSFEEIQMLFDNTIKRVDSFIQALNFTISKEALE